MAAGRDNKHPARVILAGVAGPLAVAAALFIVVLALGGPGGHRAGTPASNAAIPVIPAWRQ